MLEEGAGVSKLRALMSRWFHAGVIAKPTAAEIAEADHHADGHQVNGHGGEGHELESDGPELTGTHDAGRSTH